MKRKGVAGLILVMIITVFVATGGFLAPIMGAQKIEGKVSYYTDVNEIAEAKIRSSNYKSVMKKELEYSLNNIAFEKGGKKKKWMEGSVPLITEIEKEYMADVLAEVETQNNLIKCKTPEIKDSGLSRDNNRYKLDLSENAVTCEGSGTEAKVYFSEPGPGDIDVKNQNGYLTMAKFATDLTDRVSKKVNSRTSEEGNTAESTRESKSCPGTRESAVERAKTEAWNTLRSSYSSIDKKVWKEAKKLSSYKDFIKKTSSSTSLQKKIQVLNTKKVECTIENCDKKDCKASKTRATVKATLTEVTTKYNLKNSNKVPTYNGKISISFKFKYTERLTE